MQTNTDTEKIQTQSTLPMRASGIEHLVDRIHRETPAFQWVRETLQNALEAGATQVEFGVEWQAVASRGVYRRVIADNGRGMSAGELVRFFNTLGAGGKEIGGVHQNFGVGAKTSLLPWNRHGLVVVSWVAGQASMIWAHRDPSTGAYGLRLFRVRQADGTETLEEVVEPYADPYAGCDWRTVKPAWIHDHGTVVVLLGDSRDADTVLGDPSRPEEAELKGIANYLNRRRWRIPDGVKVEVIELRSGDRTQWPRVPTGDVAQRRTNRRVVRGAAAYVEYEGAGGGVAHRGEMQLADGTMARWYLWEGARPAVHSYAASSGYVATLYGDELYEPTAQPGVYRMFGVVDRGIREHLWLVLEPPALDPATGLGAYPRTDRAALLWQTTGGAAPLPLATWGAEFADRMPEPIRRALAAARRDEGSLDDEEARARLAERFGSRWRIQRARLGEGDTNIDPTQPGATPIQRGERHGKGEGDTEKEEQGQPEPSGEGGDLQIGHTAGPRPARKRKVGGGIPWFRVARNGEVSPGMAAAWMPHDPLHPEGTVLLNVDHSILRKQIQYWQDRYPDHLAETVAHDVVSVYGEGVVAVIAHTEFLKGEVAATVVENEMRSEAALTAALSGLLLHDHMIAQRLGSKLGRQHQVEKLARRAS